MSPGSAVMVMPRGPGAWAGAEALWVTAREWARAAERRFGSAWIATPAGSWGAEDLPRPEGVSASGGRRRPLPIPNVVRTLLKDVRLGASQSRFRLPVEAPWRPGQVRLVWEHHDLFNDGGRELARAAGAPLVRYVHAPQVWEAARWGVRRPLWGRLLERHEVRLLRGADLVACVSAKVRDRLLAMGLPPERVLISPMGVDPRRFTPEADGKEVRRRLGIAPDEVVIGWCGSFRPFHGLDGVLDAFADLATAGGGPPLRLLLVGDGPVRAGLEASAKARGVADRVLFPGAVTHAEMPAHVCAMDVTVVSSAGTGDFHYSPLKVREYAACGRPVVAPDEGELSDLRGSGFVDLHRPGDGEDLTAALRRATGSEARRHERGAAARVHALAHWTWDTRLEDALTAGRRLTATSDGPVNP